MWIGQRVALLLAICWPILLLKGQSANFPSLASEAAAARDANRLDDAAALYRKALNLNPNWTEGWWSLGTIDYDRDAYGDAASEFQKLAALDPKAGSARIMLGLSEFELGQDDSALQHIQQGERIGVADNQQLRNVALFHEGVLLQRARKFEGAQEALDSLCLAGVHSPELDTTLGMVALRMPDRIAPAQGAAAEIVPRIGRAECLAGQKKLDEARREYSAVVHNYPLFPNIHYAYGRFLLDARDTQAGIAQLEQEIKNQPGDSMARLQIAAAKYKIDSAAGLPYAEAAVKLDPSLPFGHYLLGLLLLDSDNYQRAISELEIAQKYMAEVPGVYSALGSAYARAGRDEDAAHARAEFLHWNRESANSAAPRP